MFGPRLCSVLLKNLHFVFITESDESPGMYLRDDFLGGPTELRAPTAERAALFLDAALAGRTSSIYEPALIFTLHVYQYSLAGKGGGKLRAMKIAFTQILIKSCFPKTHSCWWEKPFTSHRPGRVCKSKWWPALVRCWKCCSINFKWPKTPTEPGSSPNAFTERLPSTVNMSRRNHRSCCSFTGWEFRWRN